MRPKVKFEMQLTDVWRMNAAVHYGVTSHPADYFWF